MNLWCSILHQYESCMQLYGFWEWRLLCPHGCGYQTCGFSLGCQCTEIGLFLNFCPAGESEQLLEPQLNWWQRRWPFFFLKGAVNVCGGRERWRNPLNSKTDVRKDYRRLMQAKDQHSWSWTLSFTHCWTWLADIKHYLHWTGTL